MKKILALTLFLAPAVCGAEGGALTQAQSAAEEVLESGASRWSDGSVTRKGDSVSAVQGSAASVKSSLAPALPGSKKSQPSRLSKRSSDDSNGDNKPKRGFAGFMNGVERGVDAVTGPVFEKVMDASMDGLGPVPLPSPMMVVAVPLGILALLVLAAPAIVVGLGWGIKGALFGEKEY